MPSIDAVVEGLDYEYLSLASGAGGQEGVRVNRGAKASMYDVYEGGCWEISLAKRDGVSVGDFVNPLSVSKPAFPLGWAHCPTNGM